MTFEEPSIPWAIGQCFQLPKQSRYLFGLCREQECGHLTAFPPPSSLWCPWQHGQCRYPARPLTHRMFLSSKRLLKEYPGRTLPCRGFQSPGKYDQLGKRIHGSGREEYHEWMHWCLATVAYPKKKLGINLRGFSQHMWFHTMGNMSKCSSSFPSASGSSVGIGSVWSLIRLAVLHLRPSKLGSNEEYTHNPKYAFPTQSLSLLPKWLHFLAVPTTVLPLLDEPVDMFAGVWIPRDEMDLASRRHAFCSFNVSDESVLIACICTIF